MNNVEKSYELAKERYAELGIDVDAAVARLATIPISLHCWQGDDVGGFEGTGASLSGGIQATGNYPGKARSAAELRQDIEKAMSLIPGKHRLNLHAIYLDNGGRFVDRDQIGVEHFQSWLDWGKARLAGIDFNPTFFSHPKASDGLTLSHPDAAIRRFWIDHAKACRRIADEIGRQMQSPCVNNIWIPDGYKDIPADRKGPRQRLAQSLDEIFATPYDKSRLLDAVEGKLFGIGSESYVVGSHEFYMGYAVSRQKLLCLDAGHFHPTETISDKISAVLYFLDRILLHVSRGVRWDSDHVVILDDELHAIARELVRGEYLSRVHIGLDFFDASINRIAAWVIGARSMLKALLAAMLEPYAVLRSHEAAGDLTSRLALMEEYKSLPAAAVWDYYCQTQNVPVGPAWLDAVKTYEKSVLAKRG
ncbi:MAG: L-rhamnose isomerase [Planctomycetaceae bacterium]|nr:MAG: L-rhamnose isomerase [Planctomycetaceae bacterium]